MDKAAAGRLADDQLEQWRRTATYADLAYADDNSTSSKCEVTHEGVAYLVESTVWREQGDRVYTMAVRVTEVEGRKFFAKAVNRYGRMHPDGRYVAGP